MKDTLSTFFALMGLVSLPLCAVHAASRGIIINEIMPNNVNAVIDEDYKFPEGWVELHNTTDHDIDIQGWYLSDKPSDPFLWKIPAQCVIPSRGYRIIYTDKVDTTLPGHIHAAINMDNVNGSLYLTRDDGEAEDETPRYTDAPINHSFGRCQSDASSWVWFEHATPMLPNSDDCAEKESAPDVEYDRQGGIYYGSLTVQLTAPDPYGRNIRYTLDGSEPTEHSPLYVQPITIDSSTVIKAKIISEDLLSKPSNANSYIITDREMQLPIVSLSMNPEYLWDDTLGIYVEGKTGVYYREDFGGRCNYRTNRRRPLNMEYFVEGERVVNQLCEARIAGGWPRFEKIKGLKIYAKKRYGNKYFSYKFFPEKESKEEEGYRCIYLRNGGNDAQLTIVKDAFLQKLSGGKVDVDYQTCQPVIVYLNGQYWGIENMREPDNDDYFLSNYGIEDIDLFKNHELKEGTRDAYDNLCEFLSQPDFSHEQLCSLVDVNEFVNYMSLQAFVGNYDWPNNNYVIWRNRNNGKWRWLVKDLDGGFEYWPITDPNKDIIGVYINPFNFLSRKEPYYEHGNKDWATWPLERILSDPIVRRMYIERIAIQTGDIFHKSEMYHVIDSITSIIADEYPYHRTRWDWPQSTWKTCFDQMPDWIEHRHDLLYGMLSEYYSLGKPIPLTIKSSLEENEVRNGNLFLCGERLYRDRFDGKWFQDDSITIEALPQVNGQRFEKWLAICTDKGNVVDSKYLYDNKITIKTNKKRSYSFTAIYTDNDGDSPTKHSNRIVSLYPNPVKDKLYLQFDMIGVCHLELTDITGHVMLRESAINDSHVMNMSGLRSGVYLLRVSPQGGDEKIYKIIKQ